MRIMKVLRNRRGATAVLFAVVATGLFGTVGLTVDVARVFAAKSAFTASTQAASLAGAQALLQTGATQTTVAAAVSSWTTANAPANVTVTNTTTTLSCVTATANLPSCSGTNPNAVNVTQTGSVSTHFLKGFGFPAFSLASTSAAAKAGGQGTPMNVMFVLDSTGSMNTADTGCTISGIRNPTRYQCALYSVQSVLKVMQPSMASVGLMAFPGTGKQFTPGKPCPTQPSAVPYLSSTIYYQIGTGFSTNYNNGAGVLNDTSTIIEAVGDFGASPLLTGCQAAKGGEGTYIAEVLTKAQTALPVVAGTKNVIILLSDGDAGASSSRSVRHGGAGGDFGGHDGLYSGLRGGRVGLQFGGYLQSLHGPEGGGIERVDVLFDEQHLASRRRHRTTHPTCRRSSRRSPTHSR